MASHFGRHCVYAADCDAVFRRARLPARQREAGLRRRSSGRSTVKCCALFADEEMSLGPLVRRLYRTIFRRDHCVCVTVMGFSKEELEHMKEPVTIGGSASHHDDPPKEKPADSPTDGLHDG